MKKRKLFPETQQFPAYNKIVNILVDWKMLRHNAELCAFEIISTINQSTEEINYEDAE